MLVVLPFENLSGDPQQDYFADGMTEEMITELGRLDPQHLGVIARTSSMQYNGARKTTAEIARELGVNYLVEGSVRRQANRVRITAQLIQASDQTHVWAESFDRDQADILRVQSEVALAIAEKIALSLPPDLRARLAGKPTLDPEAHEAFLLGLQADNQRTRPAMERALVEFQRATSIDPNYAQAYAALARVYSLAPVTRLLPAQEAMPKAREAALRAIALDDSLAGGHVTLAFVKAHYEYDWSGARREYLRALELNPSDAYAHLFYSNSYLSPLGRHPEAIAEMRSAIKLDPFSPPVQSFLIRSYLWARRYDDALAQFQKCNQMFPGFALNHERVAHLYTYMGKFEAAIPEETKARLLAGEDPKSAVKKEDELRQAWQAEGATGYWKKLLEFANLPENPPEAYATPYGMAILYARLGDKDQALAWLEKAYDQRELAMTEIGIEPALDSLRSDPRFQNLLRRVGLLP
jgi:TolB-like protein